MSFDIDEVLKGPETESIDLRVSGGKIGRYTAKVIDAPQFVEGEQVLVFVQKWDGYYRPLWKKHGVFSLEQDIVKRPSVPDEYQQKVDMSTLLDSLRYKYN